MKDVVSLGPNLSYSGTQMTKYVPDLGRRPFLSL
jgi:hypothetical protein